MGFGLYAPVRAFTRLYAPIRGVKIRWVILKKITKKKARSYIDKYLRFTEWREQGRGGTKERKRKVYKMILSLSCLVTLKNF